MLNDVNLHNFCIGKIFKIFLLINKKISLYLIFFFSLKN